MSIYLTPSFCAPLAAQASLFMGCVTPLLICYMLESRAKRLFIAQNMLAAGAVPLVMLDHPSSRLIKFCVMCFAYWLLLLVVANTTLLVLQDMAA